MDAAETPRDAVRVGLAHGSVANRLPEGDAKNEIAEDRATTANLDYLALGDWHGTMEIAPKTWYSGTPEPDPSDCDKAVPALSATRTAMRDARRNR